MVKKIHNTKDSVRQLQMNISDVDCFTGFFVFCYLKLISILCYLKLIVFLLFALMLFGT